jgi:hypothetical protein
MKDPGEYEEGDIHGQLMLNYRHPHIPSGAEGELMVRAFTRDYEVNGPSVARIVRTTLAGWKRYKNHPDARIRSRFAWEVRELSSTFSAVVGAAKLYFRKKSPALFAKIAALEKELHREFGWKSRFYSLVGGRFVLAKIHAERAPGRRLTYERPPPTNATRRWTSRRRGRSNKNAAAPKSCVRSSPRNAADLLRRPGRRSGSPRDANQATRQPRAKLIVAAP